MPDPETTKENLHLRLNTFNMKYTVLHIVSSIFLLFMSGSFAMSQNIRFGLYASDGIVLAPGNVSELNFNSKQAVILGGNTVSIPNHLDEFAAILTITGRADLDVTVTIDVPVTLDLDVSNTIPVSLAFAYSNLGAGTNVAVAKTQAVVVPAGFNSITFPVIRRASGAPGPPPTPDHTGYTQSSGMAYLFIYGTLGPVPGGAAAGLYQGDINISVDYSTYD